jgi:branched-chain amino acid transport system permease protein
LLIGMLAGSCAGLLSGALITRLRGLPQLVLSIAIGQLVAALANKLARWTGGSDGLSGIEPEPVLGMFAFDLHGRTAYVLSVSVLAVVFTALIRFVRSPFVLLCRGIKDDDLRARMIGAAVYPRLIVMYGVSGAVAGLGGALSAITTGVVGLDSVGFERSAEALVMLALGGTGQLWGALAGAILFQVFEHIVSASNPFHWLTLVGMLLIIIVVFAPSGLSRSAPAVWTKLTRRRE